MPEAKKGLFHTHSNTVARYLRVTHVVINARNEVGLEVQPPMIMLTDPVEFRAMSPLLSSCRAWKPPLGPNIRPTKNNLGNLSPSLLLDPVIRRLGKWISQHSGRHPRPPQNLRYLLQVRVQPSAQQSLLCLLARFMVE